MTNTFDFTSVPRQLIYCDRQHLDDFGVEDNPSLNYLIYEKLFDRYSQFSNYEDFVTDVLNCAYYICTIALADAHPERRFGAFREIAHRQMHYKMDFAGSVLTIVLLQIQSHHWDEKNGLQRLANAIDKELKGDDYGDIYESFYIPTISSARFEETFEDNFKLPSESDFFRRKITRRVLKETWRREEWFFRFDKDEDKMYEFICAIGKTEEEQKIIIDHMREELHPAFINGAEHKYCFESLERRVYLLHHAEEERAKANAEIEKQIEEEIMQQMEADYNKSRVQELEAENAELRTQLEDAKKRAGKDLEAKLSAAKAENKTLKAENEALKLTIEGYKEQGNGISAYQNALLLTTICHHLGGLPQNGRQTLSSVLQALWGYTAHTAERALGSKPRDKDVQALADIFDETSPHISSLISEMPEILEEKEKNRLRKLNKDKKLKK